METSFLHTAVAFFREGGWAMYWILLFGLAALAVAVAHAALAHKVTAFVGFALVVLIVLVGHVGTTVGRNTVDAAVKSVSAEWRQRLHDQGYQEAARPTQFALGAIAPALVLLIIGEARRRRAAQAQRS